MIRTLGFVLATLIVTVKAQHRYRYIFTDDYEACQKNVSCIKLRINVARS